MKLALCTHCGDVFALRMDTRWCDCQKTYGRYLKGGHLAELYGPAIPLGFENMSFADAIRNRPQSGRGERFEAFVIPVECQTLEVSW